MRIVIASTKDNGGGAYIAAYRQFRAMKSLGEDAKMVVLKSSRGEKDIYDEGNIFFKLYNRIAPRIDSLPKIFTSPRKDKALCWVPNRTVSRIKKMSPQIVQIHSFNDGLMRIEDLAKFDVPIVWTLHDSWALGGADHLPSDQDERFIKGFKERPTGEVGLDLDKWVFERKLKTIKKIKDLTIVCPSSWLAQKAKKSLLFGDRRVEIIPNPINILEFFPSEKFEARKNLSLPQDKLLIGFGALAGSNNKNKGFDLLVDALKDLVKKYSDTIELVVFGDQKGVEDLPFKTHFLGSIKSEKKLSQVYSSLDIFVVPSRLENLPYSAMEAMSCGTPVVAFRTGGLPDLIDEEYLTKAFDTKDLAYKFSKLLDDSKLREKIGKQAREKVAKEYDHGVIGKKYLDLYKKY